MLGHTYSYPDHIIVSPHRLGGGYLFMRDELIVDDNSYDDLRGALGSFRFRWTITRRVISREIFGSDPHHVDVGLPEKPSPVVGPGGRLMRSGPQRSGSWLIEMALLLPRFVWKLLLAVGFLARARLLLSLETQLLQDPPVDGYHHLKFQRNAGARLVTPLVVDRLSEIELSDDYGTIDAIPNHVAWPSSHMHGASVAPPLAAAKFGLPSGPAGRGVTIAILDNGVNERHEWLKGRLVYLGGRSAATDGVWPLANNGPMPAFYGHGTFLAGQVLQAAPRAIILPLRVIDQSGYLNDIGLAKGIDRLPTSGPTAPDIIVLALGGHVHDNTVFGATKVAISKHQLANPGCVFLASAGNEHTSDPVYPAAFANVTGVAALDPAGRLACFSNYNTTGQASWVNVGTLGVGLESAFVTADHVFPQPRNGSTPTATDPYPEVRCLGIPFNQDSTFKDYASLSGTSMSTGRLAGLVAAAAGAGTAKAALAQLIGGQPFDSRVGAVL